MFAVQARRGICIADVSAGTVARPARAVIPTTRILGHVAADRALIADLRGRGCLGGLRQETVLLPHDRMPHHFGQSRHRADLEPAADGANATQLLDLAQIDDYSGSLDPVCQPVES